MASRVAIDVLSLVNWLEYTRTHLSTHLINIYWQLLWLFLSASGWCDYRNAGKIWWFCYYEKNWSWPGAFNILWTFGYSVTEILEYGILSLLLFIIFLGSILHFGWSSKYVQHKWYGNRESKEHQYVCFLTSTDPVYATKQKILGF